MKFASFSMILVLIGGCANYQHSGAPAPAVDRTHRIDRVIEDIVYTDDEWAQPLTADLYLPDGNAFHPVVLVIHGGGWAGRQREDMRGISKKLARHGYAVFNISYRFAPAHVFPAQLLDLGQALHWLSENAAQYNLDTSRINAWGYSSGAHLAALVASYDRRGSVFGPDLDSLPEIKAVVAGGIPSDLRKYDQSPLVSRFLGGSLKQIPDVYADASPAYHVSADDPPVFIYHGKRDDLVTPDQATDYYEALLAEGVDTELYLHDWWGHSLMFLFGGDAEKKAIAFLNRQNDVSGTKS